MHVTARGFFWVNFLLAKAGADDSLPLLTLRKAASSFDLMGMESPETARQADDSYRKNRGGIPSGAAAGRLFYVRVAAVREA
jgi:hypothetical protein